MPGLENFMVWGSLIWNSQIRLFEFVSFDCLVWRILWYGVCTWFL